MELTRTVSFASRGRVVPLIAAVMNTSMTAMAVLVDDGQLGGDAKHRPAREALDGMRSHQHEWRVLLEDDAVPVVALLEQLDKGSPRCTVASGVDVPRTWAFTPLIAIQVLVGDRA